ncbi:hypothetical protein [Chitinophaga sp. CF418]|uniref:hypothetical protein n=1 Tax=Chitinophaga sp. CF418 TaxID=1855287 RepID=UPI000923246F|nr:hypothetical protein [Chitinophaga sp. CF418]SHN11349.1 hypothetical protein SAMN05216311_105238 [Chitinophaga sp. CF418]
MKKRLLSAVVLVILSIACEKNDPAKPTLKVFQSIYNAQADEGIGILQGYNKLKMPNAFRIMEIDNNGLVYDHFGAPVYENGRLTQVFVSKLWNYDQRLTNAYSYNDVGKVSRVDIYSGGIIDRYDSLDYDANGHLTAIYHKTITYGADYPFGIYKKDLLVWDSSGNITRLHTLEIKNRQESKDTVTTSYTYDDKANFMSKPSAIFLLNYERGITYLSANNMLTQVTVYPTGDSTTTTTNVYTYDNENDPVTAKAHKKKIRAGVTLFEKVTDFKISYERIPKE